MKRVIDLPTRESLVGKDAFKMGAIQLLVANMKMGTAMRSYVTEALQEAYSQGYADGKKESGK